MELYG
jgi:adenylate cyclase